MEAGSLYAFVLEDPSIRLHLLRFVKGSKGGVAYIDIGSYLTQLAIQGYIDLSGITVFSPGLRGLNKAIAAICDLGGLSAIVFDSIPSFYYMDPRDIGERNRLLGIHLILLKKAAKRMNARLIVYTFPRPGGGPIGGALIDRLSKAIISFRRRGRSLIAMAIRPKAKAVTLELT